MGVRTGGTNQAGDEDASYYDIDLTESPYTPVDPTKSVVVFNGGLFEQSSGYVGKTGSTTDYDMYNVTARLIDSGQKIRLASLKASSGYWFIGRWTLIETS